MSVINDVLKEVISYANETAPYANVTIAFMPADNGISVFIGAGSATATAMDKGAAYELNIALNGKHHDQKTVSDALNDIHQSLTQREAYANTEAFQITDISTINAPNYIGREPNNQWLYGSTLRIKFYFRKA